MLDMLVYYQPFQINSCIFNPESLVVDEDRATHIITLNSDQLKDFGFEFEDGCNLGEYAQAIFQLLNLQVNDVDVNKRVFKKAGHTSMSVGDFIVFRPQSVLDDYKTYVCASAGWKVIDDWLAYTNARKVSMDYLQNLPIDVYMALASKANTENNDLHTVFNMLKDTRCENRCPDCGAEADDDGWQDKDFYDKGIEQTGKCSECGHFFTEVYEYVRTITDEVTNKEIDEEKDAQ